MTLCQNETVQFELFGWVIEAIRGVSSTFGIWASILGIEGSWTSKFQTNIIFSGCYELQNSGLAPDLDNRFAIKRI